MRYATILKTTELGKGKASIKDYVRVYPTMEDAKRDMEKSIMDLLGLDGPEDIKIAIGEDVEDYKTYGSTYSCKIDEDYAEVKWVDWDKKGKNGVEYHWYISDCEIMREVKTLYTYTLTKGHISAWSYPVICDGRKIIEWESVVEEVDAEWEWEYGSKEEIVCRIDEIDVVNLYYSNHDKEYYYKVYTYNDNRSEVENLLKNRAKADIEEAKEKARLLSEMLGE
ncbi:MAG: hypothetical protein J6A75_13620 [Lachnospiraceae bacterium]|nr:hypothetical protein [Lachnospiraceae bacterium]